MFWHRGYNDGSNEVPQENYWQARLLNLSAGGVQITIEPEHAENFRAEQLIGLQFTPMPYERPILIEGLVKHISKTPAGRLSLGVHSLGLEVNSQGRETLGRVIEIVEKYHQLNTQPEEQTATR